MTTRTERKRKRSIKSFGSGAKAKAAAEAYRDEIAPQAKMDRFWERQTATFALLWERFEQHELIGLTPGPATIADYKAMARLYLLPRLGDHVLLTLDAQVIMDLKAALVTDSSAKSSQGAGGRRQDGR